MFIFDINFDQMFYQRRLVSDKEDSAENTEHLENFFKEELRKDFNAEKRIIELQRIYDELQMKQEEGAVGLNIDKIRLDTVKAEFEQAIADLILQRHKTN